jgi:hypothetical protein
MFWEVGTIRQMLRLVTRPAPIGRGSSRIAIEARDRCGLCPACHAFVTLDRPDVAGGPVPCPECGHHVRGVDPLWPDLDGF